MTKIYKGELDRCMDADIDAIIAELEKAKSTRTYFQRATAVAAIGKKCADYDFYWTERLNDLMD